MMVGPILLLVFEGGVCAKTDCWVTSLWQPKTFVVIILGNIGL
jgi:hypothetical protein